MENFFCKMKDERLRRAFVDESTRKKRKYLVGYEDYILGSGIETDIDRLSEGDYYLQLPRLCKIEKDPSGEKRDLFVFGGKDCVMFTEPFGVIATSHST